MKASFPLGIASEKATYDIGLGNVRRGNNSETAYEVYAHQWADLTAEDGSYGVTILTNGKYGWDKPDNNTLRLTLFHSPSANKDRYVEHRTQDWGEHIVRYSILGHISSLDEAAAAAAADRMAYRMVAVPADKLPAYTGMSVKGGAYIVAFVKGNKVKTPTDGEINSLTREFATIYGEADRRGYLSALRQELGEEMLQKNFIAGTKKDE